MADDQWWAQLTEKLALITDNLLTQNLATRAIRGSQHNKTIKVDVMM